MKLTETSQVCPYTGLRSFTEEESLYFKGRDEQVDLVTAQLEEKKFLMLTGASGEGKSSLIYAGLLPNARAGFFKAKFAKWTVVDFRPERSPVRSMAAALAEKFSISPETVETEIRRGFSSLVDLYLNSEFYIADEVDQTRLSAQEKTHRVRNASNLFILVDQFEEFFTNPENYYNEHPSADSQIVVNLILETAKIALQQNIPIYIVCTMRSDYIGQCASFRGLPEYIGYSQFFVPRLKRRELRQVIEEPAVLSGNRISQRLTERLVYDLAEGVDQLPILQHALSQIWLEANHGAEEMDLIHYAMVGGMPASELPGEDAQRFNDWFSTLPEFQKGFYSETGLNKVIENHARRLYETAADEYNSSNPGKSITVKDAKNIVALAFSCLTKIDNSRAVRNRMTLNEITAVINRPELTNDLVGNVLNIFREEGNSFIRPFKTSSENTHSLTGDVVLDITHESLIRNWGMLNKWANQEYEFYSTFLDLKKHLDRWKAHGKGQGYLLPIGPLSYFENWYSKCNPNDAWISRYIDAGEHKVDGLNRSSALLQDLRDYLRRSARNVAISRAFMKYGAQRIAVIAAITVAVIFGVYYVFDSAQKKNENVVRRVQREATALLNSREVQNEPKAFYLFINERLDSGSLIAYLKGIESTTDRLALTVYVYRTLIIVDKKYHGPLRTALVGIIEEALSDKGIDNTLKLGGLNDYLTVLIYDNYYNPSADLEKLIRDRASTLDELITVFFSNPGLYNVNVAISLNESLQNWLTFGKPTGDELKKMVALISPRDNPEAQKIFDVYYPKGSYESNGFRANDFNGGYQTIASLYAAIGDVDGVGWCFDRLKDQPDYFTDKLFNNYANVIGYLYQFGHRTLVPKIVSHVAAAHPANLPQVIYRELLVRSGYISHLYRVNFQINRPQTEEGTLFLNLCLSSRDQFLAIAEDYQKSLMTIRDDAERNFAMAMSYKQIAMADHKYAFDRGLPASTAYLDATLDKAWGYYNLLTAADLEKQTTITYYYFTEPRSLNFERRHAFLYPDYIGGTHSQKYHSDLFLKYILKRGLIRKAYKDLDDLDQIHFWIAALHEHPFVQGEPFRNFYPLSDSLLSATWDEISKHPAGARFDGNLFAIILSNGAFQRGDTLAGLSYYKKMNLDNLTFSSNRYENFNRTYFYNELMVLAKNLALQRRIAESVALISQFRNNTHRSIGYIYSAKRLFEHHDEPAAMILIDSVFSRFKDFDPATIPPFLEYRGRIISLLNRIGGEQLLDRSSLVFKDISEGRKLQATSGLVEGLSEKGEYYLAHRAIPGTLTEEQDLVCKSVILYTAVKRNEQENKIAGWTSFDSYMSRFDEYFLFFGFL
jgi:energy-coupling factor transporter ATP-binding protein EcfA2